MVLSINVRRGQAKKYGHFEGFFIVSLSLTDLHPDKILPFVRCQENQKCIKNNGNKGGSAGFLRRDTSQV